MNTPKQKKLEEINKFPNWFDCLSPTKPKEESEPDREQVEQLPHHKQPLPSEESSISMRSRHPNSVRMLETTVPCLVKQPGQPELKGLIRKDLGDRFIVYIPSDDSTITVSKLFVYPDFSKSVGQIPPSKETSPPSKNSPTKQRRKKGDGTGYIYRRTITRRGKQYQESYYRYRDESGQLRSKYIPQKLLDKVEQAESLKKPIADILVLLGGDDISRGEQSSTSNNRCVRREASPLGQNRDESDEPISLSRGEQTTPPSTRRRKQGYGAGYIELLPIKRSGKEYKQYWYHWEIWSKGVRYLKKSRYIPKRLLAKVEKMEAEKAPVSKILEVLGVKDKLLKVFPCKG